MSTPADLATRLRMARTAAGLTQEDLAERSGVSVQAIRLIEYGVTKDPRLSTVRALQEHLTDHWDAEVAA